MIEAPRFYPDLICWHEKGKLLFTISIHAGQDEDMTIELQRMTESEVKRFITDIQEQLELFIEHMGSEESEVET